MLFIARVLKEMNSPKFSIIFFILVSFFISFGHCVDISFSICWMAKGKVLERQNGNIWLNDTSIKYTNKVGKLTSLTVSPAVETKLTLQYGGSVQAWTFRITPSTRFTQIKGLQEPEKIPTTSTMEFLDTMNANEVFPCEHGTVFFHQDEHFFLAIGHTQRHPVKLDSRTPFSLLVSWVDKRRAVSNSHTVTLYHTERGSYKALSMSTTTNNNYNFTALSSCSPYIACVEIAGAHSFTCLSTITDPDVPRDFKVSSLNNRRISLSWSCPENCKYSLFLLTAFFLNGTDHVTEEALWWHKKENFVFTLSDLDPCRRVKFGLQTVCQAGMESHYSKMILNDGNSAHSSIEALNQTSFGPDNYTLSWHVSNTSSISKFRVYHEGVLQGSTLLTNYTVEGLQPCQEHQARVEALCGDSVIMSTKTVATHTGPQGVSELRYRSNDSTALWMSSTMNQRAVAFLYELSLENGPTVQSNRVNDPELHLTGLEEGKTYVLDVWEECEGQWESERSHVCFEGANSSFGALVRAAESALGPDVQIDISGMGLTMVLPWSLPEDLLDDMSEPRATMGEIFKDKLQVLLKNFTRPTRIEIATFEPADEPHKTEVLFMSFDATKTEEDVPLSVGEQLDYLRSLNNTHVAITDGVIQWEGPDLCASSKHTLCPRHSLCINTLGSYMCVCQHGYYDVSSVTKPAAVSRPHCNEKGLFSQCMEKLLTGGIAKLYLTSHMGGKVDVQLNDGRCTTEESEMFYFFNASRKSSECGTERRVNKTHIEYQNTLAVSLTKEQTISRRDLKVVWKCVYPRHYIRNAQVAVDMEWLSSLSLVAFNSSVQLGLTMSLFTDLSYTYSYTDTISLEPEDTLFFQVSLQTRNSFASDVLLQVDSCWATESNNPQDSVQGLLIQDGCPVDHTLHWLSVNGAAQQSRFSVQMFSMPQHQPIYIHCLANICAHDEDCTKNCSRPQRTKRSASHIDRPRKPAAVVSAGPLLINRRLKSGVTPSYWADHRMMVFVVAGSIGILLITVLSVSASKAIMTYYERLRLK
ncbi:uncharacterized protein LOC117805478 [Notolabrus celidotus]|uniref:uncharacterized protein LOC117805478 n=1 Tax=Notolabrus celidotus TaxID=1203425 RepID=UPI00148F63DD|nr:uncharacterized protein LOC117805478 [Notolabrus celidotus]